MTKTRYDICKNSRLFYFILRFRNVLIAFFLILSQTMRTALFYAAQNGHLEMVKLLMQHGADPAIPDKVRASL